MGGKAAAVGWPLGEEWRVARRDRQRRALACSHVRKRYDTSYSWTTRLMAGARRKQSAARIQKVHVQRESQVTRENVFLFVPNLIGVYCLG